MTDNLTYGRYEPIPLTPGDDLARQVEAELSRIADTLKHQSINLFTFEESTAEPPILYDGLVPRSDGTIWNPGNGAGVYLYQDGEWAFLGGPVPYTFISPASINQTAGGTVVGDVTDVQVFNDGNVLHMDETATTPGYEMEFNFTGVAEIHGIVSNIRYDGSATHSVGLQIYDYTAAGILDILAVPHTGTRYQYRTVLFPIDADFIDGSNNSQLILSHISGGTPSHDVYIDYIGLIGKTA